MTLSAGDEADPVRALAEARRRIADLEAQLAETAPSTSTLELTLQSTASNATPQTWRVKAEWNRPGDPVACERTFTLDEDALRSTFDAVEYGTLLGRALFVDRVRDLFRLACGDGAGLRVLLAVEAVELQRWRWERLCGPFDDDDWQLLRPNQRTPFSLYIPSTSDRRFRSFRTDELRALVVISSPEEGNPKVSWFDESLALQTVRDGLGSVPHAVLANTEGADGRPTVKEICRQLSTGQFNLLHMICHGVASREKGDSAIFLAADESLPSQVARAGRCAAVPASLLIQRLRELDGAAGLPHFAFLSVCDSAVAAPAVEASRDDWRDSLRGLGQRMVRDLGVKSVLAMTDKISQPTALALGRAFYPALLRHGEPDVALAEACVSVRDRHDLTTPALFSRVVGRRLFSVGAARRTLSADELSQGLTRFDSLMAVHAPVLAESVASLTARLRGSASQPDPDALAEVERLCDDVLEAPLAELARGAKGPRHEPVCPFPGLRAFTSAQRRFFRGRDALVATLVARLESQSFVCVLGNSGSGKSSLVAAGVLPALEEKNRGLRVARMTPGTAPLTHFERARQSLGDAAESIVYVDQFEEVFTLCASDDERTRFLDALVAIARPDRRVILTMRADFLGECATHAGLRRAVQRQPELVPPMTADELRGAVEEQARAAGLRYETGLSESILQELAREPGAMPLLQHALAELWARRHGRWLRRAAWEADIGGVAGAIEKTAEDVWRALDDDDRALLPGLMTKLTRVGASDDGAARDTRQRALMRELAPSGDGSVRRRVELLVERLAGEGARLLVTSVDERTGQKRVEVAHEALLRHWPRLRGWIHEAREMLLMKQDLRVSAQDWINAKKRVVTYLEHRGERAEAVRAMMRDKGLTLDETELRATRGVTGGEAPTVGTVREYFEACVAEDERQTQARDAEERRLRDALTRARDFARMTAAREASSDPTAQVALLREVERPDAMPGWLELAQRALDQPVAHASLVGHTGRITAASFSRDGRRVVTASEDGSARVWRLDVEADPVVLDACAGPVWSAVFSPDDETVLTASIDGVARLWPADGAGEVRALTGKMLGLCGASFSPDGRLVVTASDDETARVWRTDTGEALAVFSHGSKVVRAVFLPDGERVFTGCEDGIARVWRVDDERAPVAVHRHENPSRARSDFFSSISVMALSPDGDFALTSTVDTRLHRWRTDGTAATVTYATAVQVVDAAFSPDGSLIAAALDGGVRLWQADTGELLRSIETAAGETLSVAFTYDGRHVVSVGARAIAVRSIDGGDPVLTLRDADLRYAAFSGDLRRVLTASRESCARVWKLDSPREPTLWRVPEGRMLRVSIQPDARVAVTVIEGNGDPTVCIWRSDRAAPLRCDGHTADVYCVAVSVDGLLVVTGSADQSARVWHVDGQRPAVKLEGHEGAVVFAALSRDGRRVVTVALGSAAVWSTETGQRELWPGPPGGVSCAAFLPEGERVVTGSYGCAQLWSVRGEPGLLRTFHGITGAVSSVDVSFDGERFIAAAESGVWIGRLDGGEEARVFVRDGQVQHAAFSRDGRHAVTLDNERTARVWRVEDGRELIALRSPDVAILDVALTPDGTRLVTACGDGSVRTNLIDHDVALDLLWRATPYCLSASDRVRRLGETPEEAEVNARAARAKRRALSAG